jgi:hypothetical protein
MALDFPLAPTLGQVYTNTSNGYTYEWDGSKWIISPSIASTSTGQFIVSNSAPTGATLGDIWVNTATTPVIANVWNGLIWSRLNAGVTGYGATGSEPTNALNGDLFWDTSLSVLKVFNGATWNPYASEAFVTAAVSTHEAAADPHPQYTTTAEAAAAAPIQSITQGTGSTVTNDGAGNYTVALNQAFTDALYEPIGTAAARVAGFTVSTFMAALPSAASDAGAALLGVPVGGIYRVGAGTTTSSIRIRLS